MRERPASAHRATAAAHTLWPARRASRRTRFPETEFAGFAIARLERLPPGLTASQPLQAPRGAIWKSARAPADSAEAVPAVRLHRQFPGWRLRYRASGACGPFRDNASEAGESKRAYQ